MLKRTGTRLLKWTTTYILQDGHATVIPVMQPIFKRKVVVACMQMGVVRKG